MVARRPRDLGCLPESGLTELTPKEYIMLERNTDRDWELLGQEDPYFGVCTHPRFHRQNLDENQREAFFETGREHIASVMAIIKKHIDPNPAIKHALDFGCGVGRLLIPLADMAGEVTGVDVSPSMLREARKNLTACGKTNVHLIEADDELSKAGASYDFIHSFIVFQHIPVRRGEKLLERLLHHLSDGGMGALHFSCAREDHRRQWVLWVKKYIPLAAIAINLIKGRRARAPEIHMHLYDLNRIMKILQDAGVGHVHSTFTNHRGELGVMLYFKKTGAQKTIA
jgi:SAM-dependent methyltransferase